MQSLFLGHGSPATAFSENRFQKSWKTLGESILDRPKEIVVLSAHWLTHGLFATKSETLDTIHDFSGFPEKYYQFQYSAPGALSLAEKLSNHLNNLQFDEKRGLDHGAWALLMHLYPKADIPVIQLSINIGLSLTEHVKLARKLAKSLGDRVLFIGSGNTVHNLERRKESVDAESFCWAREFDQQVIRALEEHDIDRLLTLPNEHSAGGPSAVPTLEHYLPLLYVAAMRQEKEKALVFNQNLLYGSISMLSFLNSSRTDIHFETRSRTD